jgi:predicted RNA-binding Zn-ribbon protein involved in translation (DUF1610 family)
MASRSIGNPSTGNDDAGSDRGERPPNCGSVIRPRRIRPRRNAAGIIRPDAVLHGFRFCNQERGKIVSCSYGMRSGWIGGGSAANSHAPAIGVVLDAPPVLIASEHSVDYTCGHCGTVLLHAEEGQVRGVLLRCANCGSYNSTDS